MRWRRLEGDIDHWSSLTLVTLVTLVTGQWMRWWDWKVTLTTGLCWRWWHWWHWSLVNGCIGEIGRWHWRSGGRRLMGRWFSMNGMFDNARSTIWCGKYNLMRRVQFTDESTYWTQYVHVQLYNVHVYNIERPYMIIASIHVNTLGRTNLYGSYSSIGWEKLCAQCA